MIGVLAAENTASLADTRQRNSAPAVSVSVRIVLTLTKGWMSRTLRGAKIDASVR